MCTITYLPIPKSGYILTSNRDESPLRKTLPPERYDELIYPKDADAGGTWFASSVNNRMVCLMNGAFVKHTKQLPYRRSRGKVVLDFFNYSSAPLFFEKYNFDKIEPLTLIVIEDDKLYDFRWDGKDRHIKLLNPQVPHIWMSAPLYDADMYEKREGWFKQWIKDRNTFTVESIVDLHLNGGDGDPTENFCMNRFNMVCTVSITTLEKKGKKLEMIYRDLINDAVLSQKIEISPIHSRL